MTKPRIMPDDYLAVRLTIGAKDAAKHYKADKSTVKRWDDELPPDDRDRVAAAARARQSRNSSANLAKSPLRHRNKDGFARVPVAAVPTDAAAPAIAHLRRFIIPVFDAGKVYGQHLAGVYVAGQRKLNAVELIELAVRHGYDPNAWRQVTQ